MPFSCNALRRLAAPVLLAVSLSACALGRSQVDIDGPVAVAPTNRVFAKIVEINDLRHFEASPDHAETPSLETASEITDPAITSRAIARKRGGFGMALGDVVLPAGKTVQDLIRAGATTALQDKGYTVVEASSSAYAGALPLAIDIDQFWAWMSPGAFGIPVSFNGKVTLRSDRLLAAAPAIAEVHSKDTLFFLTDGAWADTVRDGNNLLSDRMRDTIRPAP
jgi:hypothetical protein